MRFAIKTSQQNTTWADMLAVWREADNIELFESAWVFDHFYPIFSDSTGPCLDGWVALTALAQATARLRMGVLVTGIHYRHPAVLANMAATIDIISGGRLELGIGAGWNEEESGAYGIELGTLRQRSDRFEEACQVLIGLLSQETTNFDGAFYQLKDARCEPKGPQRPHPPICIGGSGERRTLRTTALYAQHWNFTGGPPDVFARKRDVLHEHCRVIGRDPAEITLSSHVRLGSDHDMSAVVDQVSALGAEGLDLAIVYLPPPHTPAVLTPLAEALAPLRRELTQRIGKFGDDVRVARVRGAPAAQPAPAQSRQQREQVRAAEEVAPVPRDDLVSAAIRPGPERVGQRRARQLPAASEHRPAYVNDVSKSRVVAVSLEVHDGSGHSLT